MTIRNAPASCSGLAKEAVAKKLASKRDKRLLSEADIKAQSLSKSDFTTSWQGRIYISDPEKSFIAKQVNIHEKGEYAIKVK